jgi:RHS repeat-associated protein
VLILAGTNKTSQFSCSNAALDCWTARTDLYVANTQAIADSFAYDHDGNMTGYNGWMFAWDAESRFVPVRNAAMVVRNSYDYMSRRAAKTVYSLTTQQPSNTTTFTYDGWAMIREQTVSETNSCVHGLDLSGTLQGAGTIGGILTVTRNQGQGTISTYYPSYDANGNVSDYAATDGSVAAHYEYDPYGNVSAKSGNLADVFPFRFSTKYTDQETGLLYYGYRFYSSPTGRWINRDPIGRYGGINLYEFCSDQAINLCDSHGQSVVLIAVLAALADVALLDYCYYAANLDLLLAMLREMYYHGPPLSEDFVDHWLADMRGLISSYKFQPCEDNCFSKNPCCQRK